MKILDIQKQEFIYEASSGGGENRQDDGLAMVWAWFESALRVPVRKLGPSVSRCGVVGPGEM